ncbi:MAG: hypothetical protein HYX52_05745 [Chloroflexi bacterium]|nr:hypothetical protein [Chloroflexota bacterium]
MPIFLARGHDGEEARILLVAGGERAGKSELTADYGYSLFPWSSLIWILGPDYEQARHEFRYIYRNADAIGGVVSANMPNGPGPWNMLLQGGVRVVTKSASDPEKMAGEAPDVLLMVEAGQQPYEALLRARGRIAEKRGRLFISGTFEGSVGWYPETWSAWQVANDMGGVSFSLPSWSNLAIYPKGRKDPEILSMEKSMPPEVFSERIAGKPMPPRGLVFPEFSTTANVRDDKIEWAIRQLRAAPSEHQVGLWIDPGYAHAYAVEFVAIIQDHVYILDEIYARGLINEEVIQIAQNNSLWKFVSHLVMDIASKTHAGASRAPLEVWQGSTHLPIRTNPVGIEDGIARTRTFLRVDPLTHEPRLFVSRRCNGLIWELSKGYQYPTDDGGLAIATKPYDRNNDAAKAVAYGLVEQFGLSDIRRKRGAMKRYVPAWERANRWLARGKKERAIMAAEQG